MVQINAILMSSGAFQFIQSEELITTAAMNTAMAKAGKAVGKYKAPNAWGAYFGRKSMFMEVVAWPESGQDLALL